MGKSSTYNTWKLQLSYYKKWQLGPPRSQNEAAGTNHFHPTYLSLSHSLCVFAFFKQKTSQRRGTSNLIRRIIRLRWSIGPRPAQRRPSRPFLRPVLVPSFVPLSRLLGLFLAACPPAAASASVAAAVSGMNCGLENEMR